MRGLLPLSLDQQQFSLYWTDVIHKSNAEMAYQFVSKVPLALKLMDTEGTKKWLLQAMDVYDKEGLYPGSAALENIEVYAREYRLSHITVNLVDIHHVLETIIHALAGRHLKITAGKRTCTDTETLFLPAAINRFNSSNKNYLLYKTLAVHLWAQTWFGTFRRPDPQSPHLSELLAQFEDNGRALRLFNLLETFRLNACIERELPGLAREMYGLHPTPQIQDNTWKNLISKLESCEATVYDTLEATSLLYPLQQPWPEDFLYQGQLDLNASELTINQRMEHEQAQLQNALAELIESLINAGKLDRDSVESEAPDLEAAWNKADNPELTLDGDPISLPPGVENLLSSIIQDLNHIPRDWLDPAGGGNYPDGDKADKDPENVWKGTYHEEGAFFYDEWDYRRQTYRKNWCVLRELTAHPVYDNFPDQTMVKYRHLVGGIRRHFETLRGEDRILRAQSVGDDIDLDALITAHADMKSGVEMTNRLYCQMRKQDRDLAVVFMIDISGSTKGWINNAERESLLLLCQALETLGDKYAIYGFSGMTRNRCEIYKIKLFEEEYDQEVRARISGLSPQDYTRMGVVIRHLSKILNQVDAKTRILITLSDGKPDDYDGYRGDYGIEDTRQALLEARYSGIHPFCITIDQEAVDYLPHMYGHASYVVVDEVRKLPLKVADIYRKLTT